jgi:hypothetical protein
MGGSCPCVQARDGIFVLAACIYAAVWSRVFLGADFGPLFAAFLRAPLDPPLAFAIWGSVFAVGLVMLGVGIRENLQDGHGAPVISSLVIIIACAAAMHHGWYLPRQEWGTVWMHISRGFYVALIAACCANLVMALGAQARELRRFSPPSHLRQDRIERQHASFQASAELDRLAAERDLYQLESREAPKRLGEIEAILRIPEVRRMSLKALHPDAHPAVSESERRALTARFQKALAVFDGIQADRRA